MHNRHTHYQFITNDQMPTISRRNEVLISKWAGNFDFLGRISSLWTSYGPKTELCNEGTQDGVNKFLVKNEI